MKTLVHLAALVLTTGDTLDGDGEVMLGGMSSIVLAFLETGSPFLLWCLRFEAEPCCCGSRIFLPKLVFQ